MDEELIRRVSDLLNEMIDESDRLMDLLWSMDATLKDLEAGRLRHARLTESRDRVELLLGKLKGLRDREEG